MNRPSRSHPVAHLALALLLLLGLLPVSSFAEVRIVALGDYGEEGPALQSVADLVRRMAPDAIITVGDNSYHDTPIDDNIGQYFADFIGNYTGSYGPGASQNRFFPSLGNHDYSDGGELPAYLEYFTLPGDSIASSHTSGNERYYDFLYGPIHFFALNSNFQEPDGNDSTSVQAQWLRSALAASTSPWKIVYFHHAPYSSAEQHGSTEIMQWPFEAWGASAVLGGHDHTYERLSVDGFPYFVNGIGGRSLRAFDPPLPESEVRFSDDYGAMLIRAESSWIEFETRAVTGDSLVDSYRIDRSAPALTTTPETHDFGNTFMTTTRSQSFLLGSTGTEPLLVLSLRLSGPDSTDFSLVGGTTRKRPGQRAMLAASAPYSLQPGASMTHTVLFSPSSTGPKNATLRIESTDPAQEVREIPLRGFGLPPPEPDILLSANQFDFGDVLRSVSESRNLRIWNIGNLPLSLSSLELGGENPGDFSMSGFNEPVSLSPGDSLDMELRFTPRWVGPRSAWLRIFSNDPQTDSLQIDLTGQGIPPNEPDIEVYLDTLAFDPTDVGSLTTRGLSVHNQGALPLELLSLSLVGADTSSFRIVPLDLPFSIAPLDSSGILLAFTPNAPGLMQASLQILSNDPNEEILSVPLRGLALEPDLAVSSMAEDFGALFVSEGSTWRSFTLTNTGNTDLHVNQLRISGPDSVHFELLTGSGPFVLHASEQIRVDVRFAPSAPGFLDATLQIHSDDPDESLVSLALSGIGLQPPEVGVSFEASVSGQSTGSRTVTTASSPAAVPGHLYVAAIASKRFESVTGVSGLGLSWSRVRAQCGAREQTGVEVWVGVGTPTAGPVTATFVNTPNSATLTVSRYSGANLLAPFGNSTSANTLGVGGPCSGGSDTSEYALDLFTTVEEALVFATVAMRYREHTPGEDFILRDEIRAGSGGNMAGLHVMDRQVASPHLIGIDGTFDGDVDWAVIGIEIRPATTPELQVSPMAYDFGEVVVGGMETTVFEIRNVGETFLDVPEIRIQGTDAAEFLVTAGGTVPSLPPGTGHSVHLQWSPASGGTKTAELRIVSNDRDRTTLDLPLQGRAVVPTPAIAVVPGTLDFGPVALPSPKTAHLSLHNPGTASLQVSSLILAGTDSLAFSLGAFAVPFSLSPGDSMEILVTFSPTTTGSSSADLRIECDAPETPVLLVPLAGEGILPVDAHVVFEESVQGLSTASPTVSTGASLAAIEGDLYLAAMASKSYLPVTSMQGMGLLWTPVRAQCGGRQQTGVAIWIGSGSPVAGPVTATFSSTPSNAVLIVARYSGADPAAPLATIVSANTNGLEGSCSGGSDSGAFSLDVSTSGEDAVVFAAVAMRYRLLIPGSGYVLRADARTGADGSAASVAVMDQEFAGGGIIPLNGTFDASVDWAVVGVEIRPRTTAAKQADGIATPREARVQLASGVAGRTPWIELSAPRDLETRVRLFDVRGRLVETLWNGPLPAGRTRLPWSGRDPAGRQAPSGVYFVLTEMGAQVFKGKLVLLH